LHKAVAGEHLTAEEASAALEEILGGVTPAPLVSALLVALRMKGEAVDEVVGFAQALRRHAIRVECGPDPRPLVDTCGTGGDGAQTFNISTASAFVVAGAGARVAKHGNRSISSRCGSADVLEELGARLELPPERVARCVQEVGIGFLFAPALHPAMRHVQPIRAELKMRTIFNLLGPLANPAGAEVQVVGVSEERLVKLVAEALARLGTKRAMVVHGSDGLDEITTTGPTLAAEVAEGRVTERTLEPGAFGIARATAAELAGGDRRENAAIVSAVLSGENGPRRDIVVFNAGAALCAAGLAHDLVEGILLARKSVDSGRAMEALDRFVRFTRGESA
ncbi:MAG: anthranilate phosphoribosyltransferase, partial [Acidobacteria bacterium]|nr:anthranilate phosphoribosyltransferase [Acidobacteriota bacterium]